MFSVNELGQLFVAMLVGGVIGAWRMHSYVVTVGRKHAAELAEQLADKMLSDFEDHFVLGYSERTGDVLRVYDVEDNFLVQGKTLDELMEAFDARFPDKRLLVANEEDELNAMIEAQK